MIRQRFTLERYGWDVFVYYAVDSYYVDEIIDKMYSIGCEGKKLHTAYENMSFGRMNTGITYSNFRNRQTVMVIALTSSPDEFQNSFDHEKGHLCRHISKAFGIDPYGEEAQYLSGEVGQKMFPVARRFLCEHCRRGLFE